MSRRQQERHTAKMLALFCRVRRFLGARPHESLEEVARRAIETTPPWSPAQDVAKMILRSGDPYAIIERAAALARPKLVPRRRRAAPDR